MLLEKERDLDLDVEKLDLDQVFDLDRERDLVRERDLLLDLEDQLLDE